MNNVFVYHLEEMRGSQSLKKLLVTLTKLPRNTPITIFLFASPQILVEENEVKSVIKHLLQMKLLRLVAYDAINLISDFGRRSRNFD